MQRLDSQPPKQQIWDQMELRRFYYPKFNPDRQSCANTKSRSPSSTTATPLSSSSLSKLSGPQIGKASNGEYVFLYFHHNTHQAPENPRAIPAPYNFNHGRGMLDRLLENPHFTFPSSTTATPLSSSSLSKLSGRQIGKASNGEYVFVYSHHITPQAPEIPRAIPVPYSFKHGKETLDPILDNPHSTTNFTKNFYIRKTDPNTTDAMIQQYTSRFGEIGTVKSIIDHLTNTCKGYGFIKYYSFADTDNCIREFYYRGHEAKFAKLGHNARLNTLGSPDNTNLYVSNLPRKMNDSELSELFQYVNPDFEVPSQKILRDSEGISREVWFARFKSPQVWKFIKSFHGKKISKETDFTTPQPRYADTNQQKMLKMETTHLQILKAKEYNTVVYGTGSPHYCESPLSSHSMSPLQSYPPNQLLPLSQNTARNISRLLVISLFTAPSGAKVIKLEDEPEIVQRLFYWKGMLTLIAALLSMLASLLALIFVWSRLKYRGKVRGGAAGSNDVEREPSRPPRIVIP